MQTYESAFRSMLANHRPYGTIYRDNVAMGIWWSPGVWGGASWKFDTHDGTWIYIGTEGWWPNQEYKRMFLELRELVGSFPGWPGEYDTFGVLQAPNTACKATGEERPGA